MTDTQKLLLGAGLLGLGVLLFMKRKDISELASAALDSANDELFKLSLPSTAQPYADVIKQVAAETGMDPFILAALGDRETGWGTVRGSGGTTGTSIIGADGTGHGLMQIDSGTWGDWIAANNWQDPYTNVKKGAEILSSDMDYFANKGVEGDDQVQAALAAYNHGPGNVWANIEAMQAGEPGHDRHRDRGWELLVGRLEPLPELGWQLRAKPGPHSMKKGWRSANLSPDRRIFFGQGRGGVRSRELAARVTASFGSRSGASTADLLFPLIFSPSLLSITPNSGPLTGGTAVDLAGMNFVAGATVTFDGVPATAVVVTPTHIFCTTPAHAVGAVNVTVTNPDSQTSTLVNGFTYLALIVAVGTNVAASSVDGNIWTARVIPPGIYNAVCYNGTLYAAVGASVAASSVDGITWISRTIPAHTYNGLAWNGSTFTAVGSAGICSVSLDGINWASASGAPSESCNGAAWSGSLFATASGTHAFTSSNGNSWTQRGVAGTAIAIAFSTSIGTFVAVLNANFWTSPTGITWTAHNQGPAFGTCVCASPTLFIKASSGSNQVATSSTGLVWTAQNTSGTLPGGALGIAWVGDRIVAVGPSNAAFSLDGMSWSAGTIPAGIYRAIAAPIVLPI